jgi:hypothetical protein
VEDASRACGGAKESAAILAGKPMLKEESFYTFSPHPPYHHCIIKKLIFIKKLSLT